MSINTCGRRFNCVGDSSNRQFPAFPVIKRREHADEPVPTLLLSQNAAGSPRFKNIWTKPLRMLPLRGLQPHTGARPGLESVCGCEQWTNAAQRTGSRAVPDHDGTTSRISESRVIPPEAIVLFAPAKAYAAEHKGRMPDNPSDLLPYLSTPEQKTMLQKFIEQAGRSSRAP